MYFVLFNGVGGDEKNISLYLNTAIPKFDEMFKNDMDMKQISQMASRYNFSIATKRCKVTKSLPLFKKRSCNAMYT